MLAKTIFKDSENTQVIIKCRIKNEKNQWFLCPYEIKSPQHWGRSSGRIPITFHKGNKISFKMYWNYSHNNLTPDISGKKTEFCETYTGLWENEIIHFGGDVVYLKNGKEKARGKWLIMKQD